MRNLGPAVRLAVSSSHPLALLRVRSRREFGLRIQGMSPAMHVPDLRRTPHTAAADTLAAL
eukprot:scaffold108544_cov50-Phaeocystis_antarctica.AAC.3